MINVFSLFFIYACPLGRYLLVALEQNVLHFDVERTRDGATNKVIPHVVVFSFRLAYILIDESEDWIVIFEGHGILFVA